MKPEFQAVIDSMPSTSAWARGVRATAFDLLEWCEENGVQAPTERDMLNGAQSWKEWAEGGCGLVYDADIAERYCTATELRRTRNGEREPNRCESWLDVEARAAGQAARFILRYFARKVA